MSVVEAGSARSCRCETCVAYCRKRPCWGTPRQIDKIIAGGFGHRLMADYWVGEPTVWLLSPAILGYEGKVAPGWPTGRCAFLTTDSLCELHDVGLKPTEGRVAFHGVPPIPKLHEAMSNRWKNAEARDLVAKWACERGLDLPENPGEESWLDILTGMLTG